MTYAQEDYRERINLDWTTPEPAISPKGLIAMAANTTIYVTDSPEKGWQGIPMPVNKISGITDLCWSSDNILIMTISMHGK